MAKEFSKKFYNSKEWAGIRQSILMRDKYICQQCGAPAEEVHHIERVNPQNVDLAKTHHADNLVSLCRDCHCREHDGHRVAKASAVDDGFYFDERGYVIQDIPPIKNSR